MTVSLLAAHARDEEAELTALTRAMTFTFLIGNADAHDKNLSLLHDGVGHISLAPLYDTVPTVLWPNLRGHLGDERQWRPGVTA